MKRPIKFKIRDKQKKNPNTYSNILDFIRARQCGFNWDQIINDWPAISTYFNSFSSHENKESS